MREKVRGYQMKMRGNNLEKSELRKRGKESEGK